MNAAFRPERGEDKVSAQVNGGERGSGGFASLTEGLGCNVWHGMARKLRLQYAGAIYHVMNGGDRREAIFFVLTPPVLIDFPRPAPSVFKPCCVWRQAVIRPTAQSSFRDPR